MVSPVGDFNNENKHPFFVIKSSIIGYNFTKGVNFVQNSGNICSECRDPSYPSWLIGYPSSKFAAMSGSPPKFTLDLIGGGNDVYPIHVYFEQIIILNHPFIYYYNSGVNINIASFARTIMLLNIQTHSPD